MHYYCLNNLYYYLHILILTYMNNSINIHVSHVYVQRYTVCIYFRKSNFQKRDIYSFTYFPYKDINRQLLLTNTICWHVFEWSCLWVLIQLFFWRNSYDINMKSYRRAKLSEFPYMSSIFLYYVDFSYLKKKTQRLYINYKISFYNIILFLFSH